jgi:uncharacterized surface protein with fasciclin (FAS1) repeats
MKFPHIATYLTILLCAVATFAQTKALATFPASLYFNTNNSSIQDALNTDEHRILFQALKLAGMEDFLDVSGPFTVFAPTNNAFERLSALEKEELFKAENQKKLKDVLAYHIVAGNLTASNILRALCRGEGKASFTTVQGTKIYATIKGTDIVLTDSSGNQAKITTADLSQSNGVIHKIDHVVLPDGI